MVEKAVISDFMVEIDKRCVLWYNIKKSQGKDIYMKKYLTILLLGCILLTLPACGGKEENNDISSSVSLSEPSSGEDVSEISNLQIDGTYNGEGYHITAPRNWKLQSEQDVVLLVSPDYPDKQDCITIVKTAKDQQFDKMTEETYKMGLEAMFDDVQIQNFEKTEIDGCNAFRMSYTSSMNGVSQLIHQVIVDGKEEVFNFTLISEAGDASEWIEACEQSIQIS